MKSIMQDKSSRQCYLCALLHDDRVPKIGLEEHHIFGGMANRKLSEMYGLKVYLCPIHHRNGPEAVHRPDLNNNEKILQEAGQQAFMEWCIKATNCSRQQALIKFRRIFGKNYLEEENDD